MSPKFLRLCSSNSLQATWLTMQWLTGEMNYVIIAYKAQTHLVLQSSEVCKKITPEPKLIPRFNKYPLQIPEMRHESCTMGFMGIITTRKGIVWLFCFLNNFINLVHVMYNIQTPGPSLKSHVDNFCCLQQLLMWRTFYSSLWCFFLATLIHLASVLKKWAHISPVESGCFGHWILW